MKNHKTLNSQNYEILETALAFGASFIVKKIIKKVYEKSAKKPAPENPRADDTSIREVIFFGIGVAVVSAGIKIITRERLSSQWEKLGGSLPKELENS